MDSKGIEQEGPLGRLRRRLLPVDTLRQQTPPLSDRHESVFSVRRGELDRLLSFFVGRTSGAGSVELLPILGQGLDDGASPCRVKHDHIWHESAYPGRERVAAGSPNFSVAS
ncbi:hypothetical protein NW767_008658 [Fusarium falciforme]|nr:hypothetical protein NW767_008658 [Fusarium falciforme]